MLNEVIGVFTNLCLIYAEVCASPRLVSLLVVPQPSLISYIAGWLESGYEAGIARYQ
jgi:hypothetical protein